MSTIINYDEDFDLQNLSTEMYENEMYGMACDMANAKTYGIFIRLKQARTIIAKTLRNMLEAGPQSIELQPQDSDKLSMIVSFADTHYGKIANDPNHSSDVKIFSAAIAKARLKYYLQKIISILDKREGEIDEVVINLLGDHIEGDGYINDPQQAEMEFCIVDQIEKFVTDFKPLIYEISERMEKVNGIVRIYGISGNHGEIRPAKGRDPYDNYDNMAFVMFNMFINESQRHGKLTNVSIKYPLSNAKPHNVLKYEVKGWGVYLEHKLPKNVQSPSGALQINNIKDYYENSTDLIFTGHYHSEALVSIGNITYIRVPSLPGFDDYAQKIKAIRSESAQSIILTSKNQKIEEYIPVSLQHIKEEEPIG